MNIITMIKPFVFSHNIFVYDGEELVKNVSATTANLEETLTMLSQEFDTTDVTICGPKLYTSGIKKKIEENELVKYNKNNLKITLK